MLHLNRTNGQALLVFLQLSLHKIAKPQFTAFLLSKLKMFTCSANDVRLVVHFEMQSVKDYKTDTKANQVGFEF